MKNKSAARQGSAETGTRATARARVRRLLKQGLLPSEIAARLEVSTTTVVRNLRGLVGEGILRFSDIYFSWPIPKREALERARQQKRKKAVDTRVDERGVSVEDVDFYGSIYRRRVFAGDLYEHIAEAELALHDMVHDGLVARFGPDEEGFWRRGIPVEIRKRCHERREGDEEPGESPFQHTTLIELAEIIKKNWATFQGMLPGPYKDDRRALSADFARLNRIRNTVMHPVRRRRWTEDDFTFARQIRTAFEKFRAD